MLPRWFDYTSIPYAEMWIDDKLWLPICLGAVRFTGVFHFNRQGDVITQWSLASPSNDSQLYDTEADLSPSLAQRSMAALHPSLQSIYAADNGGGALKTHPLKLDGEREQSQEATHPNN
eukprot:GHVT01065813.1.p2 GENE.GHVT01065813.1~~GHVT01065813.1.p2  ORF type:complete len:119 (-),score=21.83 GHVT01065813.1:1551-1907(-)